MNKYTESEKSIITSRYYDDSRQIFGAAKLCAVMKESGIRASREMVSELMRDMGFISIRQRSVPQSMDTGWLCIFFFHCNMVSVDSCTFLSCTQNGEAPLCRLLWAEISEWLSSSVPMLFDGVNLKRSWSSSLSVK
ncbi:MAG: transposase [Clostridia bacterium]|nr:transposase [Clostridia bacterium]